MSRPLYSPPARLADPSFRMSPAQEWSFWTRVTKTANCWLWTGAQTGSGYGHINIDGRFLLVHRVAWSISKGEIGRGLLVCHHCDVPLCVKPAHLFLGTDADNMRDCAQKGRRPKGERHHYAKTTEAEVREIRSLAATGERISSIGPRFGLAYSTVLSIVRRKSWKHLDAQSGSAA